MSRPTATPTTAAALARLGLAALAGAAAVAGCSSILGIDSTCRTERGVELCVERSEYAPGDTVRLHMGNAGKVVVRVDRCSLQLAGTAGDSGELSYVYQPSRRCGFDVTPEAQLDSAFVLDPGASAVAELPIGRGAPQSFNRVNAWLLEPDGSLVSDVPIHSTVFTILRSASED